MDLCKSLNSTSSSTSKLSTRVTVIVILLLILRLVKWIAIAMQRDNKRLRDRETEYSSILLEFSFFFGTREKKKTK